MKNLILDHCRRWWWVLGLCAGLEYALGWYMANKPDLPLEFYGLMIAMWSGAILLQKDWRRGAVRAVAILPLTGRQIGRAWWLATVGIPAIILTALLLLGSTISGVSPAPLTVAWANQSPLQLVPTGKKGPLKMGFAKLNPTALTVTWTPL